MIKFEKAQGRLNLIYEGEVGSSEWVAKELELNGAVRIARAFYFSKGASYKSLRRPMSPMKKMNSAKMKIPMALIHLLSAL
jgi:hypothetical protein